MGGFCFIPWKSVHFFLVHHYLLGMSLTYLSFVRLKSRASFGIGLFSTVVRRTLWCLVHHKSPFSGYSECKLFSDLSELWELFHLLHSSGYFPSLMELQLRQHWSVFSLRFEGTSLQISSALSLSTYIYLPSPHKILVASASPVCFLNSARLLGSVWVPFLWAALWKLPPGSKLELLYGLLHLFPVSQGS